MDRKQLLALRDEGPVDFVEGRILPSYKDYPDQPTEKRSQHDGKLELCQDILLELADRTKIVVAFWGLSQRCFSKNGRMDEEVAFDGKHVRKWIRVRDTNPKEKHSLSRRTKGRGPGHWKKKMDIDIYLKATRTVAVEWMLEDGEETPRMFPPRYVKTPKPLEPPGSKKAGGSKTMSSDQQSDVPGARRSGTNQGGSTDRRPAATKPPTTRPPAETRQETRQPPADLIPADEAWEKRFEKSAHLSTAVLLRAEQALVGLYMDAKINVSDAFIGEAAKAIETQLSHFKGPLERGNTSLSAVDPRKLSFLIRALTKSYLTTHKSLIHNYAKQMAQLTQDEVGLRTRITTAWISALQDSPIILPR